MPSDNTPRAEPGKILIVDDEANIRKGLRAVLVKDGHEVRDAASAEEGLVTLATFNGEAAIVDIRMPGLSGVDFLREVKSRWPHIAVVLLTGHATLDTAMAAVKEGAHDYLLKPAAPDQIRQTMITALAASRRRREQDLLFATLKNSLQRLGELPSSGQPKRPKTAINTRTAMEQETLHVGQLEINLLSHEVSRDGRLINLTPTEFQLLVALTLHKGQVIDYVTLVQLSLDYEADLWEAKELIKRHIFTLRHKIEPDPVAPQYILNVRGVGYRITDPSGSQIRPNQ